MRIKEIRKEKGISQRKAATDLGLSAVVYGRYENGARKPDPETLIMIANYLGVSVDTLLGISDEKKEATPEGGNVREAISQLYDEIGDLTDEEAAFVRASIAGIKAARKQK